MVRSGTPVTSLKLRLIVLGAIVGCYIGLGMWLAQGRPPTPVTTIPIINVDLSPGPGVGFGPELPELSPASDTNDDPSLLLEEPSEATESIEASPANAPSVDRAEPKASPTDQASSLQPLPEPLALDVLQQVEALLGTTSPELAVDVSQVGVETSEGWVASLPGGGGACGLTDAIAANLMADPVAIQELSAYPQDLRSVSNAVQLWNGEWLRAADSNDPTMPTVRRVISATISQDQDNCAKVALLGPRFVFVSPVGQEPIILVMGSGDWRWTDLVASNQPFLSRLFGANP